MKKIKTYTSFLFVLLSPLLLFSQGYQVNGNQVRVSDTTYYNYKSVNYIGGQLKRIDNELESLKNSSKSSIENSSLKNNDLNNNAIENINAKIKGLESSLASAKSNIKNGNLADNNSNNKGLWWLPWIGILALGSIGALMYGRIKKSIPNKVTDHTKDLAMLKSKLTEASAEKQTALASYINEQLELKASVNKMQKELIPQEKEISPAEPDHSLALKLADEINRMEKNLSLMDKSVKGHRQLVRGVSRLKDNLAAKGYEISELLGKQYNEGMKISATYVMDETLETGTQMITSVLKPQILFNGQLIQAAQIEVSQN